MFTMKKEFFPKKLINRETYLDRIKPFIRKPLAKVFTGQRRVGKSYMLYQLMQMILSEDPDAHIIYINKEDYTFDLIRTAADLHQYVNERLDGKRINYIFIDEIQEIREFENAVRSLILNENNDLYITGSNARLLSGDLATLLAGRTVEFIIYSLSYPEFLRFHGISDTDTSLIKYMTYGGLPYLHNLELRDEIAFEYLKNIYATIVYRDVIARNNIRSINFLERLVHFLADNTGSIFSAKKISEFLKSQQTAISHNQVLAFTDYLADAFLVLKVPRYDIQGKKIFEIGEKYYFENCGIRNCIAGYRPGDQAKLLENLVFNQLLYKGFTVFTGSLGHREIDFIARKGGETVYLQVALRLTEESTIGREFGNLLRIKDNYRKMVITMDEQFRNTIDGVEHIPIRKFLMM
jgi:uncharacterized protein